MSIPPAALALPGDTERSGERYSERYRYFVVGMFAFVSTLSFVDRQLLSILLEPIRAEFHFSDSQLGFLTGFAFAIFYSFVGIPLARLADQGSRSKLIASVIVLWSMMTVACGFSAGFVSLLLARIGVGVGEAGAQPAVVSLIGDYFEPRRRATMVALQSTGAYLGILLGFLLGGWINVYLGWRAAFWSLGLPGVLFALVFWLTVREPARRTSTGASTSAAARPLRLGLRHLWSLRSYRLLLFAVGCDAFVLYGSMGWGPAYFMRTFHMTTGQIGTWLALSAGLAGGLGCYFGGLISDRVVNKTGDVRWALWLPAGFICLSIPLQFVVYLAPTPVPALLASAMVWFLGSTWIGPAQSLVQGLAGMRMRAMGIAVLLFCNNLVGQGLGPQFVGILSDRLRPLYGSQSLRYALLIALLGASILSALSFMRATKTLRAELQDQ